jgi:hypothetical protein
MPCRGHIPPRSSGAILVVLLALSPLVARAGESDEPERAIRAERSLPRALLATPYAIVSLTAWPVKQLVFFMESVNLPARIGDAALFPARAFAGGEEL